ncbi:MAG: DinB family protein [bacterium]
MKEIAFELRAIIETTEPELSKMTDEETGINADTIKWSKKEILGHLIDSAANNHQRFVRAAYNAASEFPPYNQNEWVRIQQYNNSSWKLLVGLWSAYNLHLCDLIERLPEESKTAPVGIGKEEPVTLEFVVTDYLRHLRHHVDKILQ